MNPNHFFIVGGQRCGTTFLYELLDNHPEVEMAKPKKPEPKFFLDQALLDKGKDFYISTYFKKKKSTLGEKSTSYIESRAAAEAIKKMFPQAKIIISLRNPVKRAISNYHFSIENKIETRTLEEVFIKQLDPPDLDKRYSVNPFDYLERGEYINYLLPYYSIFSPKQIKVIVFEDFIKSDVYQSELFDFLAIDKTKVISTRSVNASSKEIQPDINIINYLYSYYKEFNNRLSEFLQVDLTSWEE